MGQGISFATLWTIARKELRDALHNRWFLLYTLSFAALSLGLSALAMTSAGIAGLAGFGRTAASLVNLVMLIVPLMALTVGAQSLAGEQERKTMGYLLAQPVTRLEVYLGKYVGLTLSLLASLVLGFGVSGLALALNGGGSAAPGTYVLLVTMAFVLSLAMLSVGFLVSALTSRAGVAVGIGLFLWLCFVFLADLGMMGTAVAMRMPVEGLFWLALANPLQAFKMAAVLNINTSLDLLGPAGIFATQEYGAALPWLLAAMLALWIVLPATAAYLYFAHRSDS